MKSAAGGENLRCLLIRYSKVDQEPPNCWHQFKLPGSADQDKLDQGR
jgi:hypothetical protein